MNFTDIDKESIGYSILRAYVNWSQRLLFYRKIHIEGKENIPLNAPIFFAPNHQNALMDALVIACNINQQPVFIARADIFKNPLIAKLLIAFKILPAYRIRDGKENLGKNDEIFNISVKILENKHIITLFPETTHHDKRQLQILKKGVQRIVFQAEEKNNFTLGTKVLPIGIYYSSYWNFKADIIVNFGKPIEMNEFNEIYQENQQKGMLALRDKLSEEIKKLIIHIPSKEYYELNEFMRDFYNSVMLKKLSMKKSFINSFKASQKIIACLDNLEKNEPEEIKKLENTSNEYNLILKKINTRNWVVEKDENPEILLLKSIGLFLISPVFLYGFINNFLPYYAPNPIRKKIKDPQFVSSVNFVLGIVIFPLFYLLQFALVWIFSDLWWIKIIYLLTLPFAGLAAFNIHRSFVKLRSKWRYLFFKKSSGYNNFVDLKNRITQMMDITIEKYQNTDKS